jgi:hypothetical protein
MAPFSSTVVDDMGGEGSCFSENILSCRVARDDVVAVLNMKHPFLSRAERVVDVLHIGRRDEVVIEGAWAASLRA